MLEYFACVNLLMLTRLIYLRSDTALGRPANLWLSGLQLALVLLCFGFNTALWLVLLMIVIAGIVNIAFEHSQLQRGLRLLVLAFLLISIDLIQGASAGLQFRPLVIEAVALFTGTSALLQNAAGLSGVQLMTIGFGLLLLANEINLFIRLLFHQFGLEPETFTPGKPTHSIDKEEYNAGRVIGILERWLMFVVVLSTNDLSAIAFILAAKGLARMKQLDEKEFAEYMLIGTLLSVLGAVLTGKAVLVLIANQA